MFICAIVSCVMMAKSTNTHKRRHLDFSFKIFCCTHHISAIVSCWEKKQNNNLFKNQFMCQKIKESVE